jgi:diaminopropionate ammonia-lyase
VDASDFLWNPRSAPGPQSRSSRAPLHFHRRLPGYRPTRLLQCNALAQEAGLKQVWIKDESSRLGLPAFKILGVSWAVYRALVDRLGSEPSWQTLDDLRDSFARLRPLCLVSATTGNHGRALARIASLLGLRARIYIPAQAPAERKAAIREEGAEIVECEEGYDDAVEQAASWVEGCAAGQVLLLSDTAPTKDDPVSLWISEGYSTLFWEIEDQLAVEGEPRPDTVIVQIGAGSLALTAATHFRRLDSGAQPKLLGVEAESAACFQASARSGAFQTVSGPSDSQMFCLNVGVPSRSGFDQILAAFDAFVAIPDEDLGLASRALAASGMVAGPTGAAGLMGLWAALPQLPRHEHQRVLLINTEGAADPIGYGQALLQ